MALISIPTSIGGVTIPGALVKGPLAALFGNAFKTDSLQYPRDLGSATKNHYVKFTIMQIKPVSYADIKSTISGLTGSASSIFSQLTAAASDPMAAFQNFSSSIGSSVTNLGNSIKDTDVSLSLQPETVEQKATIALYTPDTMQFTYAANYGQTDIASAAASVPGLGKVAGVATNIINADASKLALRKMGYAFNPQIQLIFDGIDFRTYQMVFTFTPYSRAEAETIDAIIKLFKLHQAPTINRESGGMFFIPPSMFDVEFYSNGKINSKVNKIARSVITTVDVNYATNGWSTHTDGSPTQIMLTLQFKETVLIDRAKISEGY